MLLIETNSKQDNKEEFDLEEFKRKARKDFDFYMRFRPDKIRDAEWIASHDMFDNRIKYRVYYLPRAYARGETDERPRTAEECKAVDHYEFYIPSQNRNHKWVTVGTIVWCKLPKQNRYGEIFVSKNGEVSFTKESNRYFLREFDELDRRIIKGFFTKYAIYIVDGKFPLYSLYGYRYTDMPKRIKQRKQFQLQPEIDAELLRARLMAALDESSIFRNVEFLN